MIDFQPEIEHVVEAACDMYEGKPVSPALHRHVACLAMAGFVALRRSERVTLGVYERPFREIVEEVAR